MAGLVARTCHDGGVRSFSEMLATDSFAVLLGVELAGEDPLTLTLTLDGRHQNFHGTTHGGVVFSLADCAFALAANRQGDRAVAIDTHLVLPGGSKSGDVLTAVAEETTRGKTIGTYRVTVSRGDGRTVGLFTGTVHISS